MGKLLYIQASPRIQRSHSIAVTNAFVAAYEQGRAMGLRQALGK